MQPEPKKHVSHTIAWSLIALLAGSLAFGIWMYFSQISDIYDSTVAGSISHKKTTTTKPTTTTKTTTTDATADWKTYTNDTYGFSFKYPKDWTADKGVNAQNELLSVGLILTTDKDKLTDTDNPGLAQVHIFSKIKDLDTQNQNPTSIKDYLDKYAKLADPVYIGVTAKTIGGLSGYEAKMGPNQFGGGSVYFVTLNDGKILELRTFNTGITTDQIKNILSTFTFTK